MLFKDIKAVFITAAAIFLVAVNFSFARNAGQSASPEEVIKHYRQVLKIAKEPGDLAEAHYMIGYALEKLGRDTEATAEYLKIMVNYPAAGEISKKAEERLSGLYSGFSEKSQKLTGGIEIPREEENPTIFFAYVKSLYENYRNLGQYGKALSVLKKLYDMDAENPSYLVDIGGIYLYGYNDADRAIFHFKKAIGMAPENIKAYIELGKAYELKEDYDNAVNTYSRARDISPASPWAIYGLRRIDAIRLAENKALVKDWYFIGPFDNSDTEALKKTFPPEEKIDLKAKYIGKGGEFVTWFRPFGYGVSGYVDFNALFKLNDYAVSYALSYVHAPQNTAVQLRFGAEDGVKVWLGDRLVFERSAQGNAELDDIIIPVGLKKGWNRILIKVTDTWGAWGFYFRITDSGGESPRSLIFDPERDNERVKKIYGRLRREKRFRITKIAAIYTVAIAVFLLGLYFMVSNIYGKIKIRRMKDDFVSSVSHELKTPISAVKMLTETLKRGKIKQDSRREEYYDMIIRESDRLTRFINKILDFSKLEKGGKVFYFEKANIVELAKTTVEIYIDEAQDEGMRLEFESKSREVFAEVDKDAIFQVIFNLIDNASKYSKDNKDIRVTVRSENGNALIAIADKGLGIAKSQIEKIFDKFYRAERDIVKGIKGSGLGLAFVKSVVDAHRGKIAVQSELGKGTTFIISLPMERE